jgi:hypothetical protein
MKYIQLSIELTDDLALKKIVFLCNDTGLESDSKLVELIGIAFIKSIYLNKDDLELTEMLDKLGIKRE